MREIIKKRSCPTRNPKFNGYRSGTRTLNFSITPCAREGIKIIYIPYRRKEGIFLKGVRKYKIT
jgi:hypothetical protein